MKPECSLPCSQESTVDPYPELDASSPHLPATCEAHSVIRKGKGKGKGKVIPVLSN
jgi:hypothetical protein